VAVSLTSPVTGTAQTGLTSPTYTVTTDAAVDYNGKQWAVTALGGTQTGVTVSSVASPFTISFYRPKNLRVLSIPDVAGVLRNVPMNDYFAIVRKGVTPLAGQAYKNAVLQCRLSVPAGSDTADAPNIRAALSLLFGALSQQSAGIGDTLVPGIM
jgi:hypothetical protein